MADTAHTPARSPFALGEIRQIAINIEDLERATAFYRDVLGLKLLFAVPPKMAFFDCGGIRLMLTIAESSEFNHPGSILYYKVDDIQGAYETLQSRGAKFEDTPHMIARMPDHELWMAFLRDSENNLLAVMSEVRQ